MRTHVTWRDIPAGLGHISAAENSRRRRQDAEINFPTSTKKPELPEAKGQRDPALRCR
jgi:hypothetical protein